MVREMVSLEGQLLHLLTQEIGGDFAPTLKRPSTSTPALYRTLLERYIRHGCEVGPRSCDGHVSTAAASHKMDDCHVDITIVKR